MAVRRVLRAGDPRLRRRAQPVDALGTAELARLVEDLFDTMASERGAGLAAPQVGVGLRVVVFGFDRHPRWPDEPPVPFTALVNPVVEPVGEARAVGWEGCLSVPGLRGPVARYTQVRYRGLDPDGRPIERQAHGFHARLVQHECDHLDGVLYLDRLTDARRLGFVEELEASGALAPLPCEDDRAARRAHPGS